MLLHSVGKATAQEQNVHANASVDFAEKVTEKTSSTRCLVGSLHKGTLVEDFLIPHLHKNCPTSLRF